MNAHDPATEEISTLEISAASLDSKEVYEETFAWFGRRKLKSTSRTYPQIKQTWYPKETVIFYFCGYNNINNYN